MNGTNAVDVRSLRRAFKGGIEAVRDIDLSVAKGEVFGFLGPNGAGKTTTVRMFCTLLPPTAGSASVAGIDVVADAAEVRHNIGVALQEIGLDPVQTGRELLELQCGLYGITGRRGRERTAELLELVGLTEAADRRTKTYSGGMKRRLDLPHPRGGCCPAPRRRPASTPPRGRRSGMRSAGSTPAAPRCS